MAAFYERACARLADAGYVHYEISNWALPGFESRHNLKYWQRQPYCGFGAGAHSFNGQQRWANAHDPAAYVAAMSKGRFPSNSLPTFHATMRSKKSCSWACGSLPESTLLALSPNTTQICSSASKNCAHRDWLSGMERGFAWRQTG